MISYNMQSVHKNILVMIVFSIILVGGISALTYQVDTEVDINLVCINVGFCSSAAECNVSVFSPNGIVLLDGVQATQSASLAFFNITLNDTQTSDLGEYQVGRFCRDGSVIQIVDFTFNVTPTGKDVDTAQGIIIIALILILIALTAFFFNAGNKTESIPFKVFLTSMGVLFLMVTTGVALNTLQQLTIISSVLSGTFLNIYRLMLILVSAGGIGLMLHIIIVAVQQFKINRGLIDPDD